MNEIISSAIWSPVRLLDKNEFASGGVNGNMNEHAIALANRTHFLKEIIDELKNEVARLTELVENCNCTGGSDGAISVGISPDLQYQDDLTERNIHWAIEVNGELYPTEIGSDGEGYSYLEDYLLANKENLGITGEYVSDDADVPSGVYIRSITNTRKFVRLIPDAPYAHEMKLIGNPTAKIDSEGVISFWLEANNEVIEPILCTPTEEFTVKVLKTDYKENDVLRVAWRLTDENDVVTTGSDTYTLSDYYDPTLNNPGWRYGYSPLDLIGGVYELQGNSIESWSYGGEYEPWQTGCIGGVSVMGGALTGRGLADFTSDGDMDVTLRVFINGEDRSFTVQHPFLTAVAGNTEHLRLLMKKVSDQLELLGLRTKLSRGYLYQGETDKYWGHHVSIFYDHGQFNSVSIGGNLIIGNSYTPRWDTVNFFENCEISKNGVNTPADSIALFRGRGKNDEGDFGDAPYVSEPRTLEFLPCADLGVTLNNGEIDFIPTTDHPDGFIVSGCGFFAGG